MLQNKVTLKLFWVCAYVLKLGYYWGRRARTLPVHEDSMVDRSVNVWETCGKRGIKLYIRLTENIV